MPIDEEIKWFDDNRARLLTLYFGKYVLIKDQDVRGSFDSAQAAYEAAVNTYGLGDFLVRQVLPSDPVQQIPALWVGILRASA